jgi:hypothetical protein
MNCPAAVMSLRCEDVIFTHTYFPPRGTSEFLRPLHRAFMRLILPCLPS